MTAFALSRRATLAGFLGLAFAPAALAQTPALTLTTDFRLKFSDADQAALDAWIERLRAKVGVWWPILTTRLASPDYTPTSAIQLRFITIRPEGIPAATVRAPGQDPAILIDPGGLLGRILNPDTLGMIGHEMVHVVQNYPRGQPGWLVEGIADYMRYYVLIPEDPARAFSPDGAEWSHGYQPTAGLLDFVETAHPGAVHDINAAMRAGGDGPALLEKIGGAPPEQLWRRYLASRPAAMNADAERRWRRQIQRNAPNR